jgi:hypothetical protein
MILINEIFINKMNKNIITEIKRINMLMSHLSNKQIVLENNSNNSNVLFPDWLTQKITDVHYNIGQGSIFSKPIEEIINLTKEIINDEPNIKEIANTSGTISRKINNIGYDLVLPIEIAKTLENAKLTTTTKIENDTSFELPAVKTTMSLSDFSTDQLTIIVRPMKNETGDVIDNSYIILSVFPGSASIPRISEWNGQYAVIIPELEE